MLPKHGGNEEHMRFPKAIIEKNPQVKQHHRPPVMSCLNCLLEVHFGVQSYSGSARSVSIRKDVNFSSCTVLPLYHVSLYCGRVPRSGSGLEGF